LLSFIYVLLLTVFARNCCFVPDDRADLSRMRQRNPHGQLTALLVSPRTTKPAESSSVPPCSSGLLNRRVLSRPCQQQDVLLFRHPGITNRLCSLHATPYLQVAAAAPQLSCNLDGAWSCCTCAGAAAGSWTFASQGPEQPELTSTQPQQQLPRHRQWRAPAGSHLLHRRHGKLSPSAASPRAAAAAAAGQAAAAGAGDGSSSGSSSSLAGLLGAALATAALSGPLAMLQLVLHRVELFPDPPRGWWVLLKVGPHWAKSAVRYDR